MGARARRLARPAPRPRAARHARRGDVHRRRSALLDRAGRRPEHAHARRRGARAPPRAVRARRFGCRRSRALHRRRRGRGRPADRRARARRRGRAAARARRPAGRGGRGARARLREPTPTPCSGGTTRSSRRSPRSRPAARSRRPARGVRRAAARHRRRSIASRASLLARRRAGGLERGRGRVQRRRAAVRRDRDDRGDDRQRGPRTCSTHPGQLARSPPTAPAADAIEESLRLEPAAAVVDRYATARRRARRRRDRARRPGEGLDRRRQPRPGVFADPDRFDSAAATPAAPRVRRTARTSASGCTWPASRRTRAVGRLLAAARAAARPGAARAARARVPQAAPLDVPGRRCLTEVQGPSAQAELFRVDETSG